MESESNNAGKGDSPRNCFSQKYRDNYDEINWHKEKDENEKNCNNSNINVDEL